MTELSAVGVQIFSNVLGRPLDKPETMPLFDLMVDLDRPVWLHRQGVRIFPITRAKRRATMRYGGPWDGPMRRVLPWRTSSLRASSTAFPTVKIITHHLGGMIPYFEGRIGPGWDQLGDQDVRRRLYGAPQTIEKKAYRLFPHVLRGHPPFSAQRQLTICGLKFFGADHVLFGSDSPFDPEKASAYIRWTINLIDKLPITRSSLADDESHERQTLGSCQLS